MKQFNELQKNDLFFMDFGFNPVLFRVHRVLDEYHSSSND